MIFENLLGLVLYELEASIINHLGRFDLVRNRLFELPLSLHLLVHFSMLLHDPPACVLVTDAGGKKLSLPNELWFILVSFKEKAFFELRSTLASLVGFDGARLHNFPLN